MKSTYRLTRFMLVVGFAIAILVGYSLQGDRPSTLCLGLGGVGVVLVLVGAYATQRAEQRRRRRIKEEQLRVIRGVDKPEQNPKS